MSLGAASVPSVRAESVHCSCKALHSLGRAGVADHWPLCKRLCKPLADHATSGWWVVTTTLFNIPALTPRGSGSVARPFLEWPARREAPCSALQRWPPNAPTQTAVPHGDTRTGTLQQLWLQTALQASGRLLQPCCSTNSTLPHWDSERVARPFPERSVQWEAPCTAPQRWLPSAHSLAAVLKGTSEPRLSVENSMIAVTPTRMGPRPDPGSARLGVASPPPLPPLVGASRE